MSLVPLSKCPPAYLLLVEDNKQFGPVVTAFHHRANGRYNDAIETTMTIRMMEGHEYVLVYIKWVKSEPAAVSATLGTNMLSDLG